MCSEVLKINLNENKIKYSKLVTDIPKKTLGATYIQTVKKTFYAFTRRRKGKKKNMVWSREVMKFSDMKIFENRNLMRKDFLDPISFRHNQFKKCVAKKIYPFTQTLEHNKERHLDIDISSET